MARRIQERLMGLAITRLCREDPVHLIDDKNADTELSIRYYYRFSRLAMILFAAIKAFILVGVVFAQTQ